MEYTYYLIIKERLPFVNEEDLKKKYPVLEFVHDSFGDPHLCLKITTPNPLHKGDEYWSETTSFVVDKIYYNYGIPEIKVSWYDESDFFLD